SAVAVGRRRSRCVTSRSRGRGGRRHARPVRRGRTPDRVRPLTWSPVATRSAHGHPDLDRGEWAGGGDRPVSVRVWREQRGGLNVGGWTVVMRGIRYRSGRSLMFLLLASIATAATVVAPAYARAAQQSVLSDRLADAPVNATGLHLSTDPLAGDGPESTVEAKLAVQQLLNQNPTLRRLLGTPNGSADPAGHTGPAR